MVSRRRFPASGHPRTGKGRAIDTAEKKKIPRYSLVKALLAWVVVIGACAAALEFTGPWKGWFERVSHRQSAQEQAATAAPDAATPANLPPPPEEDSLKLEEPTEAAPKEPAKTPLEKEFDELYEMFLAKLPRPKIGEKYRLYLRDRTTVDGRLAAVSPGKVEMMLEYGTMAYAVNQITRKTVNQLFPERAAKWMALRELRRRHQPQTPPSERQAARPKPGARPVGGTPQQDAADDEELAYDPTEPVKYDSTPASTPERLAGVVKEFGGWMTYQHRRVGGKIADKVYAKQQGPASILYLVVNPLFSKQDYDLRFQIAEGLQKFWAFRCEGAGICGVPDAHLVLLDTNGRTVGGSTTEDSSDVWVAKDVGRAVARRR